MHVKHAFCLVIGKTEGSQVAERLGNRASNQKVAG